MDHCNVPLLIILLYTCIYSTIALDSNEEKNILLSFKSRVSDPQNSLSSWNNTSPHCNWVGISCTKNGSHVRSLYLPKLGLTGTISPQLSNLSSLLELDLSHNLFYGRIPNELGQLKNLLYFRLHVNQFTGEIPDSIFNISSLVCLSVTQNKLVGKVPTQLGLSLPNLTDLLLAANMFHGFIPTSLSNASRIKVLELSSNSFTGSIPLLGNMKNLTDLRLAQNFLSSNTEINRQVIDSLTNCTHLEVFILASNQLEGELPNSIANLSTHLREFRVDGNLLSGRFPQGIENYGNLSVLFLQQNAFTDRVPNSIGVLRKLQRVSLYQNKLFGEIPDNFSNLTQLYELLMGSNQFSGRIPNSIGDCPHLTKLGLANNRLSGRIPKEIFGLPDLRELRLANNSFSGSLPIEVGRLKQLEFMDISGNQFSGNIPLTIGECSSLGKLYMARNKFSGPIPKSMGNLRALESLDLSSNNLSGSIPEDLEDLKVLQILNLSFNDLEGQIPNGMFMNLSWDSLQGNNKLCNGDQEASEKLGFPRCSTKKKGNESMLLKIVISISSFIVLVCVVTCLRWIWISQKKKKSEGSDTFHFHGLLLQKISYSKIVSATNGFAAENLIGKGGFGFVYKGIISGENETSSIVAIKVINQKESKASQSFTAECETLRNIRHRNLVKVITSCSSIDHGGEEFMALVMEFMSNGSLDKWLHPEDIEFGSRLNLNQRLNIAIDVASAMDYLHNDCDPPVVHCDLKSSNVLLDSDMVAHVGDFGLARFLAQNSPSKQSCTIELKGSIGYIAPEYGVGGKVSRRGDVYSYGILLLEIFTGKSPTNEMFKDGLSLSKFASAIYENRLLEIVDSRLFEENDLEHSTNTSPSNVYSSNSSMSINNQSRKEKCITAVITVGLACAADLAKDRLTMRQTLAKMIEIKTSLLVL